MKTLYILLLMTVALNAQEKDNDNHRGHSNHKVDYGVMIKALEDELGVLSTITAKERKEIQIVLGIKSPHGPTYLSVNDYRIIPIEKVIEKATKRHFYNRLTTKVVMKYSLEENILVWVFTNPAIIYKRNRYEFTKLVYNAHTGAFIGQNSIREEIIE